MSPDAPQPESLPDAEADSPVPWDEPLPDQPLPGQPVPDDEPAEAPAPWDVPAPDAPLAASAPEAGPGQAEPPPHPEILAHNAPLYAASPTMGPKPRRKGIVVALTAIGVVVVGILAKVLIGFLAAGVVGGAVGLVFGGPFQRLPAEQQQQFEQRVEAALGDSLDGQADAAKTARMQEMIAAGLVRLDDAALVERVGLFEQMLERSDPATCGALARYGSTDNLSDDVSNKAVESLDTPALGRWFDINISAFEAEARGAPAARTVAEDDVQAVFDVLLPKLTADTTATLISMNDGTAVTDAQACDAYKDLYRQVLALPADQLTLMALYEVTP